MSENLSIESILWQSLRHLFKAHPWHGVSIGDQAPRLINAYIEMVPVDAIKYEIDKATGHLKVDRPQKYSSRCPTMYGLVPQTYCGTLNGAFCAERTGRPNIQGDGDPLDICVFSERPIPHGDILVRAVPIGGLRMIDGQQADDKIIAVLYEDLVFGKWTDVSDCPPGLIERLRHYFLTYKDIPGAAERKAEITHVYNAEEAYKVIEICQKDYLNSFAEVSRVFASASRGDK